MATGRGSRMWSTSSEGGYHSQRASEKVNRRSAGDSADRPNGSKYSSSGTIPKFRECIHARSSFHVESKIVSKSVHAVLALRGINFAERLQGGAVLTIEASRHTTAGTLSFRPCTDPKDLCYAVHSIPDHHLEKTLV
jgi:hypothetical protein